MICRLYPIERALPNRIAIVARPRGGDWLSDDIKSLANSGITVLASMLTSDEVHELGLEDEAAECESVGIAFLNIPVSDRSIPSDTNVFLGIVDRLAERVRSGEYLGVHCRASIGRSSILAVSVLVHLGWEFEEACRIVEEARCCAIPDTPEQRQWVKDHFGSSS